MWIQLVISSLFTSHLVQVIAVEFPPFNGWYNNMGNPSSGTQDSSFSRRVYPTYEDGVYAPSGSGRPNPRMFSNTLFSGEAGLPSTSQKTALFYFFGEHVMREIADGGRPGCPPEYFNIPIPIGDPIFDPTGSGTISMPYQRRVYDTSNSGYSPNHPRDQLNGVTSFLDGSSVYGDSKAWSDQLRLFKANCPGRPADNLLASQFQANACAGEMTSQDDLGFLPAVNSRGLPLENPVPPTLRTPLSATRFYQTGGKSINEDPYLMAMGVIWFRHHNWLARNLSQLNPDWSEERVFNEARRRNIAIYQKLVMYDWLPLLLGDSTNSSESCQVMQPYTGYSSGTSTSISDVFETAAKHYLLTIAPGGVLTRKPSSLINSSQFNSINSIRRICNTYWSPNEVLQQTPIEEIILGMSSQLAEEEDRVINDDLRNSYHGPLHFSRRDLVALIIQQGRDFGIPDYNSVREALGLGKKNSTEDINPDLFQANPQLLGEIDTSMDNLDVFVGGMLETRNGRPGELFRCIIIDQFRRLRDGDRFWFENSQNSFFDFNDIQEINSTSLRDVIMRTNPSILVSNDIQDNPLLYNATNYPQEVQVGGSDFTWPTNCTGLETYDYFSTSQASFAVVFACIGLFVFLAILLMYLLAQRRQHQLQNARKQRTNRQRQSLSQSGVNGTVATEVLGAKSSHQVQVTFGPRKEINVKTGNGRRKMRTIVLHEEDNIELLTSESSFLLAIRTKMATYDVVLKFSDEEPFRKFFNTTKDFLSSNSVKWTTSELGSEKVALQNVNTKEKRDKVLQTFFKDALAQALKLEVDENAEHLAKAEARNLVNTTISKEEFADYLKLKVESSFVEQMFAVADTDEDGMISFQEFLDIVVLFTKGSPDDKAKLMFDMYDHNQTGELSVGDFTNMLKSMMEMVNTTVDLASLDHLVSDLIRSHGLQDKQSLQLEDFLKIMSKYNKELSEAHLVVAGQKAPSLPPNQQQNKPTEENRPLAINGDRTNKAANRYVQHRLTRISRARMTLRKQMDENEDPKPIQRRHTHHVTNIPVVKEQYTTNKYKKWWIRFVKWNQHYRNHIFCAMLYTCITVGVFLQSHNVVSSNLPSGLGRIGGGWPAVARASAAALMFNFSTLLLTMSRNTITLLRETVLHRYIPFDGAIAMHKLVAWMALFFTALHVVAHGINFYSISTQTPLDLLCLFRDYWFPSDFLPSFVFWCFQTITGITGVLLTLDVILMYVFASNYSRRAIFNWFQGTHKFGYIFLYFFSVLHGSGTLISSPRFYLYFLGPAVLYTIDKLYSLSRKKVEISVVKAELLPSDVTHLEFKRPQNFDYKAGQWVRIACLAQSPAEYHPFTLSSAPHESTLKLHIRAVGPWTMNLRSLYDPERLVDSPYPKLYLDGPFGEGHQDWYKYEVSVLVGGGIGVTPFASILKDLVNTTQSGSKVTCQAVYFIWVTRDQKQYEWLMDIIKEVENKDKNMILNTHIFITQFPQKFDLRTTMLYICEQQFQKIAGRSLFTGLKAVTHFGRPNFPQFLGSLADQHNKVNNFGVFSCGPPAMTSSVEKACVKLNKYEGPSYSHHFENF